MSGLCQTQWTIFARCLVILSLYFSLFETGVITTKMMVTLLLHVDFIVCPAKVLKLSHTDGAIAGEAVDYTLADGKLSSHSHGTSRISLGHWDNYALSEMTAKQGIHTSKYIINGS